MKILDVHALDKGIDGTKKNIQACNEQVETIQKAIEGVISLESSFKGKAAESIRMFYATCHKPFLLYMTEVLQDYKKTLVEMQKQFIHMSQNQTVSLNKTF